jgi:hypothetical protein
VPQPAIAGRRWTKHGKDRLFLTLDGAPLGNVDLTNGTLRPDDTVPVHVLAAAAARHASTTGITLPPFQYRGLPWPDPTPTIKAHDLAANRPGSGVAREARSQRSGVTKAALEWAGRDQLDALGVARDDQIWDAGAKGERVVGKALTAYCSTRPHWHALHSVPVGHNGADIDHVLIGPPGVIVINTKYHPHRHIHVTHEGLYLDKQPVDYATKSRIEADRAQRLIAAATHRTIPVTALIVLAEGALSVESRPSGVTVLHRSALTPWLDKAPHLLDPSMISRVYAAARNRRTWQPPTRRRP